MYGFRFRLHNNHCHKKNRNWGDSPSTGLASLLTTNTLMLTNVARDRWNADLCRHTTRLSDLSVMKRQNIAALRLALPGRGDAPTRSNPGAGDAKDKQRRVFFQLRWCRAACYNKTAAKGDITPRLMMETARRFFLRQTGNPPSLS